MRHLRGTLLVGTVLLVGKLLAQADGLVAYVPEKPIARTADDTRITFVESAVAGKIEAIIPPDADRVDILNARGNVKHTYGADKIDQVGLGDLRPGTWTLRVHRGERLSIRRFVVMERGTVVWSPQGPVRKR
ncbi:MAG: hypothetical protein KDC03_04965 [Flavobacteriales bacterium]|nr:hypothetical protein [Flavobacteriales bacterium]MCB0778883.1 hypothetical protein [Flavobacteriales bacterium]